MTLFNRLNSNEIHVRVNYGKADVCGTGPFMWIRANKSEVDQFIDSETLIDFLRPPIKFAWRKILFYWVFGMIFLTMAATLSFVLVVNKYDDPQEIKTFTFSFLGVIFFLVIIELVGIVMCFEFFERQLEEYVERLNRNEIGQRGLELYYPAGYCWGKNINVLGIKRTDVESDRIREKSEDNYSGRF